MHFQVATGGLLPALHWKTCLPWVHSIHFIPSISIVISGPNASMRPAQLKTTHRILLANFNTAPIPGPTFPLHQKSGGMEKGL